MSARAYVVPEHNLLVSQFRGTMTDELFITYYENLISFDAESPMLAELVDFRAVDDVHINPDTLSIVAHQISDNYPIELGQFKCAVVAPTDLGYGFSRMYELGNSPANIELKVFRQLSEASRWLTPGLDPDAIEHLDESSHLAVLLFEVQS